MRAELADGRVLEFPDGTDPLVIQKTVKKMVGQQPAVEPEQSWQESVSDYAHMGLPAAGAAIGGVIGAGAGAATGPGAPVASPVLGAAGGTLGYGIGERIAKGIDELMGLRQSGTLSEEAMETLDSLVEGAKFEMGGQAVGAVGGKILEKGIGKYAASKAGAAVEDMPGIQKNVLEAQAAEQATGIPIYKAQQTLIPKQLEQQVSVSQLTAGTRKAAESLRVQNEKAGQAVDELLNSIATPESIVTGPARFRTAAQKATDAQKVIRTERASPLYEEAFKVGGEVDTRPIVDMINTTVKDFPEGGEVAKSLLKVKSLISGKEQKSLIQLHNAKLEIDQMLSKFGESSLGNTTKREIVLAKNELMAQMEKASPTYESARLAFEEASPAVKVLEDSIIGKTSRMSDTQLKNISKTILDPTETNPVVMRKARQVIKQADPEAWDMIVRAEIERRIGSIKPTQDATQNLPGQLNRAIFGNDKQSRVLFEAVEGDANKNLRFLQTALDRASKGRSLGSPTATRTEIIGELKGGVVQSIRDWVKAPVSKITGVREEAAFNKRVKVLTESLFDPKWKTKFKELRKFDSNSPAASKMMTQILIAADKKTENK